MEKFTVLSLNANLWRTLTDVFSKQACIYWKFQAAEIKLYSIWKKEEWGYNVIDKKCFA